MMILVTMIDVNEGRDVIGVFSDMENATAAIQYTALRINLTVKPPTQWGVFETSDSHIYFIASEVEINENVYSD